MKITPRILITLAILSYGVAPLFADLNPSHLLHPDWTPHSRLHMAWLLATNSSIAVLAAYLLWRRDDAQLAGMLSVCVLGGFWVAGLTSGIYGGAFSDVGGIDAKVFGFDGNGLFFALTLVLCIVGMVLDRSSKTES